MAKQRSYLERTVRGTRREASTALAALVLEAARLTPSAPRQGTIAALCQEWLAHATSSLSPRTVVSTRGYLDQAILPALGHVQAARLTTADLDRFYRRVLKVGGPKGPYAPATVQRVHGIIRRALSQKVRWGWISHNPAIDASPPRVPHRELRPPTPKEVVSLFAAAQTGDPALAAFLMLAALRLHDLRHYVATRLLTSGIDVRTVAGRLGHRNPSTTLNVYAHFLPGSDREASAALARLFGDAEEVEARKVRETTVVAADL